MPPRPVHRSRVFWFGLVGLLFLIIWWVVPQHSVTLLTYTNIEATGYGLEIRPDHFVIGTPLGWIPRSNSKPQCWSYPITDFDENPFTSAGFNRFASFPNYDFLLAWLVLWLAALAIRRNLGRRLERERVPHSSKLGHSPVPCGLIRHLPAGAFLRKPSQKRF